MRLNDLTNPLYEYEIINELFMSMPKGMNDQEDYQFIAHRDTVWFYQYGDESRGNVIMRDLSKKARFNTTGSDVADQGYGFSRERPDLVTGIWQPKKNEIAFNVDQMGQHPITSILMKKIVNQLGNPNVISIEDFGAYDTDEYPVQPNQMKGGLPDVGYHGTSTQYIREIFKIGLRAGESPSNWNEVEHDDKIFFSVAPHYAAYHANLKLNYDEMVYPVIIEFDIPDKNKIIADYDVASRTMGYSDETDELNYSGQFNMNSLGKSDIEKIKDTNKGTDLWKGSGVFGYQGWIPPKFITGIIANFDEPGEPIGPNSRYYNRDNFVWFWEELDHLTGEHWDEDEDEY